MLSAFGCQAQYEAGVDWLQADFLLLGHIEGEAYTVPRLLLDQDLPDTREINRLAYLYVQDLHVRSLRQIAVANVWRELGELLFIGLTVAIEQTIEVRELATIVRVADIACRHG